MRRKPHRNRRSPRKRGQTGASARPRRQARRHRNSEAEIRAEVVSQFAGLRTFNHHLVEVADALPWFGEAPFEASGQRRTPRPVWSSPAFLRRVLLAFLAGRPISEVARRAGCGIRTIYTVINGLIYWLPLDDEIPIWLELGLFGVVEPRSDQPPPPMVEVGLLRDSVAKNDVLLFCLVCHAFMGGLDNTGLAWRPDPDFGQILLGPAVIRDRGVTDKMQGHLVAHFRLQDERVASPAPIDYWTKLRAGWARAAEEWDNPDLILLNRHLNWKRAWFLGEEANKVLDRRHRLDGAGSLPSMGGRPMNLEKARKHWSSLIPDRYT